MGRHRQNALRLQDWVHLCYERSQWQRRSRNHAEQQRSVEGPGRQTTPQGVHAARWNCPVTHLVSAELLILHPRALYRGRVEGGLPTTLNAKRSTSVHLGAQPHLYKEEFMYVVVNHAISDASKFWAIAKSATAALPAGYKVIHTFPSSDGRKAVCVWEGPSVEAVRGLLDPATAGVARNDYFEAPNKEGMAMPTLTRAAGA